MNVLEYLKSPVKTLHQTHHKRGKMSQGVFKNEM